VLTGILTMLFRASMSC